MLSIVMPVYNQHKMTQECLEAIHENTRDYEIILVDNGSNPPIEGASIRNETNLGFPIAVNQGIRTLKGEIICLLNNDVIITPGWADRFLHHLENFAIVAPLTNYCAGLQQQIALGTYNDEKGLYAESEKWAKEHDGEFLEVNFVIGFCMAFRKSLWEELGPFDESLWPCSGEEIDFCFKAREKGYRIGIARDAYVHHIGSQTFYQMEKNGQLNYRDTIVKNDAHLEKKWGRNFWNRQIGPIKERIDNAISGNGHLRLNLGCGLYPIAGFINIDLDEKLGPDLVCDALHLPYGPGTVDEIYAGHLLEHLTWEEGQKALRHWHDILKPGGKIMITVPDFDVHAKNYLANPTAKNMRFFNDMYIYSYVQESLHRYCYGPSLLKAVMTEAGFGDIEKVPYDHPYFTSLMEDQITFKGVK